MAGLAAAHQGQANSVKDLFGLHLSLCTEWIGLSVPWCLYHGLCASYEPTLACLPFPASDEAAEECPPSKVLRLLVCRQASMQHLHIVTSVCSRGVIDRALICAAGPRLPCRATGIHRRCPQGIHSYIQHCHCKLFNALYHAVLRVHALRVQIVALLSLPGQLYWMLCRSCRPGNFLVHAQAEGGVAELFCALGGCMKTQ